MRPLIAGNWKMHGLGAALGEILGVAKSIVEEPPSSDVLICPPFTLIARAVAAAGGRIAIGAQDCHAESSGAFTGDVSAEMLADAGASAVIVGHSERRRYHGETDIDVAMKTSAAWRAGLRAIVCIGETEPIDLERHHSVGLFGVARWDVVQPPQSVTINGAAVGGSTGPLLAHACALQRGTVLVG